jgi:hypothetical protein
MAITWVLQAPTAHLPESEPPEFAAPGPALPGPQPGVSYPGNPSRGAPSGGNVTSLPSGGHLHDDVSTEQQALTAGGPHASGTGRGTDHAPHLHQKQKRRHADEELGSLCVGNAGSVGGEPSGSASAGARKRQRGEESCSTAAEMPGGGVPSGDRLQAPGGVARQVEETPEHGTVLADESGCLGTACGVNTPQGGRVEGGDGIDVEPGAARVASALPIVVERGGAGALAAPPTHVPDQTPGQEHSGPFEYWDPAHRSFLRPRSSSVSVIHNTLRCMRTYPQVTPYQCKGGGRDREGGHGQGEKGTQGLVTE